MNQNIPLSSVDTLINNDVTEEVADRDTTYISEETTIVALTICCLFLFTLLGITVVGLIALTSNNKPPNTPEPTAEPTSQPTLNPTSSPTEAIPTPEPTDSPALDPTPQPTISPTSAPTTPQPTSEPTNQPTAHPTEQPTFSPTEPPIVPVPPGDGKCCVAEGSEICAINTESVCIGEDFRNLWLSPFTVPCDFQVDSCSGACCQVTGGCQSTGFQECYTLGGEMILEQSCSINCTAELGSCCFSDCSVINGTGCLERPYPYIRRI